MNLVANSCKCVCVCVCVCVRARVHVLLFLLPNLWLPHREMIQMENSHHNQESSPCLFLQGGHWGLRNYRHWVVQTSLICDLTTRYSYELGQTQLLAVEGSQVREAKYGKRPYVVKEGGWIPRSGQHTNTQNSRICNPRKFQDSENEWKDISCSQMRRLNIVSSTSQMDLNIQHNLYQKNPMASWQKLTNWF